MTRRYVPPGLSNPKINNLASVQKWIDKANDILRVGTGQSESRLDTYVTFRDLFESGLTKEYLDGVYQAWGGDNSTGVIPATADGPANYDIPPAPTGLVVASGIGVNILQWTNPATLYGNHAYTEVWRSATNNLGAAVKISTWTFHLAEDTLGTTNTTYYYWIRFVSKASKPGPYNAGATSGVAGTTAYVVAGNIFVTNLAAIKVDAGELTAGTLTGLTIQTATSGARIVLNGANLIGYDAASVAKTTLSGSTGLLTAVDANITGTITTTTLNATGGTIGGATISATALYNSTNIALDFSGKKISINSATFGALGIQLDYNAGNPRMYVGDGATKSLEFDGTDVKIGSDSKLLGADAYNNDNVYWAWDADSLDGWDSSSSAGGTVSITSGTLFTSTGTTSGSLAIANKNMINVSPLLWSKNRKVKNFLKFQSDSPTNLSVIWGIGNVANSLTTGVSLFFSTKSGSNLIYAASNNGSATTESSTGLSFVALTRYKFEIIFLTGVSAKFYIDDVLYVTVTTNLPSGATSAGYLFGHAMRATGSASVLQYATSDGIKFLQDP